MFTVYFYKLFIYIVFNSRSGSVSGTTLNYILGGVDLNYYIAISDHFLNYAYLSR